MMSKKFIWINNIDFTLIKKSKIKSIMYLLSIYHGVRPWVKPFKYSISGGPLTVPRNNFDYSYFEDTKT